MSIEKPNKAEVWKTIYRTLIANEINPVEVRMHPNDISVTVQLQDSEFDDVAAAMREFGLGVGAVWSMNNDGPHLWSPGEADEFYVWGRYCNYSWPSPLLPGWNVSVYCQVRTADYPLPAVEQDAKTIVAEALRPGPLAELLPDTVGWDDDTSRCARCRTPYTPSYATHCVPCDGPMRIVSGGAA